MAQSFAFHTVTPNLKLSLPIIIWQSLLLSCSLVGICLGLTIRLLCGCPLVGALLGAQQFQQVYGQAQNIDPFYVITQNNALRRSTIWSIDPANAHAKSIVALNEVSQLKADEVLSQRELSVMQSFSQKETLSPQSATIKQYFQQIQRLDTMQLMLLSNNDVCNRNTMNLCFGYYELLRLNTSDPSKMTSLLKIDYHPKVFDEWGCIRPTNEPIIIDHLLINPKHDVLVYTLRASHNCYTKQVTAQTVIVDFSKLPVSITEIPMARGVSWSPDGNRLAYYSVNDCPSVGCETSVNIITLFNGSSTPLTKGTKSTVATITLAPNTFTLSTGWINNNTLLYQWYGGIEEGAVLVSYNLDSGIQRIIHLKDAASVNGLYYMNPNHMIFQDQTSLKDISGFGNDNLPMNNLNSAQQVFYNSRFTDRLLFSNQIGCLQQIFLIDAVTLKSMSIDLSSVLPKNECPIFGIG
ncbi:MAG: hypothetical protein ABI947_02745 [Chloroflexota bacterium]